MSELPVDFLWGGAVAAHQMEHGMREESSPKFQFTY